MFCPFHGLLVASCIALQGCFIATLLTPVPMLEGKPVKIRSLNITRSSLSHDRSVENYRQVKAGNLTVEVVLNEMADSGGYQGFVQLLTLDDTSTDQVLEKKGVYIPAGSSRGSLNLAFICRLYHEPNTSENESRDEHQRQTEKAEFYFRDFNDYEVRSEARMIKCLANKPNKG